MFYLRFPNQYLSEAQGFDTFRKAKAAYKKTAQELIRYGQTIDASIHFAESIDTANEYPNCVLTYNEQTENVIVEET